MATVVAFITRNSGSKMACTPVGLGDVLRATLQVPYRDLILVDDSSDDTVEVFQRFCKESNKNLLVLTGNYPEAVRVMSPLVASYDNEPSRRSFGDLTMRKVEDRIAEVTKGGGVFWSTENIPHRKPCNLWDNMSIDVEGYVLQCCNWSPPKDWNYGTVEELMEEGRTLKEVWAERLANRMRNPLCRSCNMKAPDWKERLDNV